MLSDNNTKQNICLCYRQNDINKLHHHQICPWHSALTGCCNTSASRIFLDKQQCMLMRLQLCRKRLQGLFCTVVLQEN